MFGPVPIILGNLLIVSNIFRKEGQRKVVQNPLHMWKTFRLWTTELLLPKDESLYLEN